MADKPKSKSNYNWRKKWTPPAKPTNRNKNIFTVMAMSEEELAEVVAKAKGKTTDDNVPKV